MKPLCFFALFVFFGSCKTDVVKNDCSKYFSFNPELDDSLLTDYSKLDTLRYQRQIGSSLDTLIFVFHSYSDNPLIFQGLSPETCHSSDETSEMIRYEYREINTKESYTIEIRGRRDTSLDKSTTGSTMVFSLNGLYFVSQIGNPIGDTSSLSYSAILSTATGTFTRCWTGFTDLSSFEFTRHSISGTDAAPESTVYYNQEFGLVQVSFNEGAEIWSLIE